LGSVKDLQVLVPPVEEAGGVGRFFFSDRYSVFDWGEMPDRIPHKGASLCLVSAYFFERLEEKGIKTHYRGLVENGAVKRLAELSGPAAVMEVGLLRVIEPAVKEGGYDYSVYREKKGNFLIPLEVIYRNALPPGSSVFRRLSEGSLKPEELGLAEMPVPGQVLERPLLDVSTKLEASDRYLSWAQARELAGLTEGEVAEIKRAALTIGRLIAAEAGRAGLVNEDGKVEFGFDGERNLLVVDALGTLDECRFTFQGAPVSKEAARIFYKETDWYREVEAAKKKDKIKWKELVKQSPPPLPPRLKELISQLYCAYANEVTGRVWFAGIPPLAEVVREVKKSLSPGQRKLW